MNGDNSVAVIARPKVVAIPHFLRLLRDKSLAMTLRVNYEK